MTKDQLITKLMEKMPKETKKDVNNLFETVIDVLFTALAAGDDVTLTGIGTLKVKAKAARPGRNPKTKEAIVIPARKTVAFTASTVIKKALN